MTCVPPEKEGTKYWHPFGDPHNHGHGHGHSHHNSHNHFHNRRRGDPNHQHCNPIIGEPMCIQPDESVCAFLEDAK